MIATGQHWRKKGSEEVRMVVAISPDGLIGLCSLGATRVTIYVQDDDLLQDWERFEA